MTDASAPASIQPLPGEDRRVHRTREAVLQAFFSLVLSRNYDSIRVGDIIDRSGVGRSTFYAHFRGKDDVLACSLAMPFSVLADAIVPGSSVHALAGILAHFHDNRVLAQRILGGPRRRYMPVLVGLVEDRLRAQGLGNPGVLMLPPRLAAVQLAACLMAPMDAWLAGVAECDSTDLAVALQRSARATLAALRRT